MRPLFLVVALSAVLLSLAVSARADCSFTYVGEQYIAVVDSDGCTNWYLTDVYDETCSADPVDPYYPPIDPISPPPSDPSPTPTPSPTPPYLPAVSIVNVNDDGPYQLPVTVDVDYSYDTVDLFLDGNPLSSALGPFYSFTTMPGPDISAVGFGTHTLSISACGSNGCSYDSKTFDRGADVRGDSETVGAFWLGTGTGSNQQEYVVPQAANFDHSLGVHGTVTTYNVTNIGGHGHVQLTSAEGALVYNELLGCPEPMVSVSLTPTGVDVGGSNGTTTMNGCGQSEDLSGGTADDLCGQMSGFGLYPGGQSTVSGVGQMDDPSGLVPATFVSTGVNPSWY